MADLKILELENNLTDLNEGDQALVIGGLTFAFVFAVSKKGAAGSFAFDDTGTYNNIFTLANVFTDGRAGAQIIFD